MQKMKAQHLVRYGSSDQAFEVREVNIPTPSENEVLIKIEGFGLNFADVMARLGLYEEAPPLPAVLGYDVVGRVSSVGSQVAHIKPGDRVVALTRFGGYAEYAIAQGFACAKISDQVSIAEATALATQFCTAQYMIEKKMRVFPKDKLLIHSAAGGVGSALVQLALRKKAHVIATVGSENKSQIVRKMGVLEVVDTSKENFKSAILQRHGKNSIDAVFDAIGGKSYRDGMSLLKPGGTFCSYGVAESTNKTFLPVTLKLVFGFGIILPPLLMRDGKTLAGVNMLKVADYHPQLFHEILTEVIALHQAGEIKPLVGGEYPVSELAKAHDLLQNRKTTGKIAIRH